MRLTPKGSRRFKSSRLRVFYLFAILKGSRIVKLDVCLSSSDYLKYAINVLKSKFFISAIIVLLSTLFFPSAYAFQVQSKCISVVVTSAYPFAKPIESSDGRYTISYQNTCSTEVPSVEIALVEKDGYEYRVITGGGRIGKVAIGQKGNIELSLPYSTFNQVQSTVYLYVKENYPLENRSQIAMSNVTFSANTSAPSKSQSPTPISTPTPTPTNVKSQPQTTNLPSVEKNSATLAGLKATWPKYLYMPQTFSESRDPVLGQMLVQVENLNPTGFFWDISVGMTLINATLPATGDYVVPTFATSGALNSGTSGVVVVPLSYTYFLGLKGPVEASIRICASEKYLTSMDKCLFGTLVLEHTKRLQSTSSSVPQPTSSPQPIKNLVKSTITCIKGNLSKKVTSVDPKCPSGYKKK